MSKSYNHVVSSSTPDVRLVESGVHTVGPENGVSCYRVEIDVDGDSLPVGFHVLAPCRESAYNKLAVAFRRLGCDVECADRLNFVEE